jgi:hypothetical protein
MVCDGPRPVFRFCSFAVVCDMRETALGGRRQKMERGVLAGVVSFALLAGLAAAAQRVLRRSRTEDAIHGRPFPSSQLNKWWI